VKPFVLQVFHELVVEGFVQREPGRAFIDNEERLLCRHVVRPHQHGRCVPLDSQANEASCRGEALTPLALGVLRVSGVPVL